MNDETLVTGLRKGEPQAQIQLVQSYGEPLVRFLISVCGADQVDAEDVAIEAIYRAIERIDSFRARNDNKNSFRNWLFTIARNQWRDRLRKHPPMARFENWDQIESPLSNMEADFESDSIKEVQEALSKLPEKQRLTLQLHYGGLELKEVAQVLGTDSGKVRQWKRRGLIALSQLLDSDRK